MCDFFENVTGKTTVTRWSRVNQTGLSNNGSNFRKRKLIFLSSPTPGFPTNTNDFHTRSGCPGERVRGPSRSRFNFVADLSNRSDFLARRLTSIAEPRPRPFRFLCCRRTIFFKGRSSRVFKRFPDNIPL